MTAATVVVAGVEFGIVLALIVSLLQFVRRSYQPHTAVILADAHDHWRMEPAATRKMIEPGLVLYWFVNTLIMFYQQTRVMKSFHVETIAEA